MTGIIDKCLALGNSNITAEFQRICGIRGNLNDSKKCNGVNGNSGTGVVAGNGSAGSVNGAATVSTTNGYDSSAKSMLNGHLDHQCNGIRHESVHHLNGALKERNHIFHKNGYKNGFSRDNGNANTAGADSQNGHTVTGHDAKLQSNGHVDQTSSEISATYTVENKLLYYVFSFGASLGNEVFYILFFSCSLWNFDSYVVRKVLIVWCVIMYIGQAAKDIIRWPRPKSPPVFRLEERYELEYGMPSTHAMVGVAIPFGMLVYMSGRYEFNLLFGMLFAIAWSILVSFSRLYLGMHSALDIVAGLVFAFLLMGATVPFVDPVDKFLISHPNALPILVAVCIALCLLYPSLDKWSTARGDTTLVLAVFSGIYAGLWLTGQCTDFEPVPDSPPYILGLPTAHNAAMALIRLTIGVAVIVVLLTTIKTSILKGLAWLFGMDPKNPETKQHLVIELPYKYVSYFVSAAAATYLMPLVFLKLNIERQGYYSEIFNHSIM